MSTTTASSVPSPPEFTVDAVDIIRLMLGYLTSVGLHHSARTLREESGIGFANHTRISATLASSIRQGEWASVARVLQLSQNPYPPLLQEQIILELAERQSSLSLAQTLLALTRDELDQLPENDDDDDDNDADVDEKDGNNKNPREASFSSSKLSKARSLEQRLAAIAADPKKYREQSLERTKLLYGKRRSKQERRNRLAQRIENTTTLIPLDRLPTLLQQACKWQSWTGQLPYVKQAIMEDDNNTTDTTADNDYDYDKASGKNKKKKNRSSKKRKHYDLILGTARADRGVVVGDPTSAMGDDGDDDDDLLTDPIPSDIMAKIKFGKSAVCEAACFVTNNGSGGQGLITASSDGLIEIWDAASSYKSLNTGDYPFQADDSVMGHDNDTAVLALAISHDQTLLASGDATGIVKIWNLQKGLCLRQHQAHSPTSSITALDWSRDASRLLTASSEGVCREFGIVSQHVLQEYTGHTSYIHSCQYVLEWKNDSSSDLPATQWIVTGSADGTARLWRQGQCYRIWQPSLEPSKLSLGASIVVDPTRVLTESPAIVTIRPVPGRQNQLLVVPRSAVAYLVDLVEGTVLQVYQAEASSKQSDVVFCAATVTADRVFLCTTANDCRVFRIGSGRLEQTISDFGLDSTTKTTSSSNNPAEVTQLLAHPFKPILAAFSNEKTQKKGILAVWK